MKLALGTAQFGMPYGIANQSGKVSFAMADSILECARQNGIDTIDTAMGYADSENVLGRLGVSDFRVITKLSEVPTQVTDARGWIIDQVEASLKRLRIDKLAGILLHRPQQLLGAQGHNISAAMAEIKKNGWVEKVGVSIYDPYELSRFQEACSIDLVQAPFSVIDRRLVASGWLERLKMTKVEVHVRSLFLQGLLLMAPSDRPPQFTSWNAMWRRWDNWLAKHRDVGAIAACIAFGQKHDDIDRFVVGVDSDLQLKQLVAASNRSINIELPDLFVDDERLINPSTWALA